MRLLAPDDAADLIQEAIQEAGAEQRNELLAPLDEPTKKEVIALLAYNEDEAGGLMNPRSARLRPEFTVDVAISYLRKEAQTLVQIYITRMFWTRNNICSAWSRCDSCLPLTRASWFKR